MVVDPGWLSAGFSAEITSKVLDHLPSNCLKNPPLRIALPDAPVPTSKKLEKNYYTKTEDLIKAAKKILKYRN